MESFESKISLSYIFTGDSFIKLPIHRGIDCVSLKRQPSFMSACTRMRYAELLNSKKERLRLRQHQSKRHLLLNSSLCEIPNYYISFHIKLIIT